MNTHEKLVGIKTLKLRNKEKIELLFEKDFSNLVQEVKSNYFCCIN
jgi:hypothetical protein